MARKNIFPLTFLGHFTRLRLNNLPVIYTTAMWGGRARVAAVAVCQGDSRCPDHPWSGAVHVAAL